MVERFQLKLHQQSPCYYELIDNKGELKTFLGFNITFDDGSKADYIVDMLNQQEKKIHELEEQLEPFRNLCIDYNLKLEHLPSIIEEAIEEASQ